MKRIPLTQDKFAIVDDEDFAWLSKYKWCANWSPWTKSFYAMRSSKIKKGNRHPISMAREILGLKYGDKLQADHIDHDTLDNRRLNLRAVTSRQNHFNLKNARGYHWQKANKKYHAAIKLNGKPIYLGVFSKASDARNAYLQAKKQYHKF